MSDTVPDYQADRLVLRFVPAAPTWPEGSSLTAGDLTAADLTLTWTAAQDPTAAEQTTKGAGAVIQTRAEAGNRGESVQIQGRGQMALHRFDLGEATKGGTHFTGAGTLGFTVEIEGLQSGF